MDIVERLLEISANRAGGGPSSPNYDPDLLCAASDAADEITRLRGAQAADDERLSRAAQRVGVHSGCDAAEWMADEIARLRDENANLTHENDKLWAELNAVASALPGVYYMDPPDRGGVTTAEQVTRMAKDAERYRWLRDIATSADWEMFGYQDADNIGAAIDAAMRKGECWTA